MNNYRNRANIQFQLQNTSDYNPIFPYTRHQLVDFTVRKIGLLFPDPEIRKYAIRMRRREQNRLAVHVWRLKITKNSLCTEIEKLKREIEMMTLNSGITE